MIRMDLQEGARSNKCESTLVIFYVFISFKETSVVPPTSLLLILVICLRLFIAALSTLVLTLGLCGASTFGYYLCSTVVSVRLHPLDLRCSH